MERTTSQRRRIRLFLVLLLIAALLPMYSRNGETRRWQALAYSITRVQEQSVQDARLGTVEGTRIRILCWIVRDDTHFTPSDAYDAAITGT